MGRTPADIDAPIDEEKARKVETEKAEREAATVKAYEAAALAVAR